MSCSYSAHTVVGCRLYRERMYQVVEKFAKDHSCPEFKEHFAATGKYPKHCPDCGKRTITKERSCTLKNGEEILDAWRESRDGLTMVVVTDGMNGNEWVGHFVASCDDHESGGHSSFLGELNFAELRDACEKNLEPLGLWDPESFGLHTILAVWC
jgi:predicted RNA-binding Zn-ribbon protein involved in translation (DUF1610 family)